MHQQSFNLCAFQEGQFERLPGHCSKLPWLPLHSTPSQSCCAVSVGHSLSAEVKDVSRVCCNPQLHKQGGLHRVWHESCQCSLTDCSSLYSLTFPSSKKTTNISLTTSQWLVYFIIIFIFKDIMEGVLKCCELSVGSAELGMSSVPPWTELTGRGGHSCCQKLL